MSIYEKLQKLDKPALAGFVAGLMTTPWDAVELALQFERLIREQDKDALASGVWQLIALNSEDKIRGEILNYIETMEEDLHGTRMVEALLLKH